MSTKFMRVYKPMDVGVVKEHLFIYGDLSGQCANCQTMDLKMSQELVYCPNCRTDFKYIAFRHIQHHLPKLHALSEARPDLTFIDYEDYTKQLGAKKAEDLFK